VIFPISFKGKNSFTLLELLVVVAIIAVITGVAVAAFNNFSRTQRLSQAAKGVEGSIKDAQSRALSSVEGLNWGIRLTLGSEQLQLYSTPTISFADAQTILDQQIGSGVILSDLTLSQNNTVNVVFSVVNGAVSFTSDEGSCLGGSTDSSCSGSLELCLALAVNLQGSADKRYLKVNERNIFESDGLTPCP